MHDSRTSPLEVDHDKKPITAQESRGVTFDVNRPTTHISQEPPTRVLFAYSTHTGYQVSYLSIVQDLPQWLDFGKMSRDNIRHGVTAKTNISGGPGVKPKDTTVGGQGECSDSIGNAKRVNRKFNRRLKGTQKPSFNSRPTASRI